MRDIKLFLLSGGTTAKIRRRASNLRERSQALNEEQPVRSLHSCKLKGMPHA